MKIYSDLQLLPSNRVKLEAYYMYHFHTSDQTEYASHIALVLEC